MSAIKLSSTGRQEAPPRWLVTGGSGRIGRMVLRQWRLTPPIGELVLQTRSREGGLCWDPLLTDLPNEAGTIDCIIGLAGITPATGQPLEVNSVLAEATLQSAHRHAIPRVLLTSSSAVYGASPIAAPFCESSALRPLNAYGKSKVEMEAACQAWREKGIEVCCLRIGNVAGADALLLNWTKIDRENPALIDWFTDGRGPIRSYVGPRSMARILECLAGYPYALPPVLNIAVPQPIDMADLAEAAGLPWIWRKAPTSSFQRITLDCKALENVYKFASIENSVAEMSDQWKRLRDSA